MATSTASAPAAAPAAPPAAPDLTQIEALLRDLTGKMDRLQAENAALKAEVGQARAAQPRITERAADDPHNVAGRRAAFAGLKKGEARSGVEQLPVDAHGKRIPDVMLDQFGPRYGPGDGFRLRRDVRRDGFKEGDTWGSVLDRLGCDGAGIVLRQQYLTKLGEWKYVGHVPGLTRRERGDGFYEHEIEPA